MDSSVITDSVIINNGNNGVASCRGWRANRTLFFIKDCRHPWRRSL